MFILLQSIRQQHLQAKKMESKTQILADNMMGDHTFRQYKSA